MNQDSIIGYTDPLVVSPGSKIAVKVSCGQPKYSSKVLRLLAGYDHPDAPAVAHESIDSIPQRTHDGELQFSRTGSFLYVSSSLSMKLLDVETVNIQFWCQPTLPEGAGHEQYLFSFGGIWKSTFDCFLDESGTLCFRAGKQTAKSNAEYPTKLERHRWYNLQIVLRRGSRSISLRVDAKGRGIGEADTVVEEQHILEASPHVDAREFLIIASNLLEDRIAGQPISSGTFNGRIDDFQVTTISRGNTETLLHFDFSLDMASDHVRDISGNNYQGKLANAPTRAVTGHNWDASQNDWTRAPYGYGAIHFHDDDLDDAGWTTSFELSVPRDLRSGCYGMYVDDGKSHDIIPFFVRPDPNAVERPSVAIIMPTFTYTGKYLNGHTSDIFLTKQSICQ